MTENFEAISQVIKNRRTVKPNLFNRKQIPDEQIRQLLELADWAPTHGRTEPWRFHVYAGDAVKTFCQSHAEMYRANINPENYPRQPTTNYLHMGDLASHVIIAVMQRGNLPKIPALEEIAATACAVQNVLLGAEALGIAAYWGSGGMAYKPPMKAHLNLREEDMVLGILYVGFSDQLPVAGKRLTPLAEKITWHS